MMLINKYKLLSLSLFSLLLLVIIGILIQYYWDKPEIVSFDFPLDKIIVPVSINGMPPKDFLLDSGGIYTVIDTTLVREYVERDFQSPSGMHIKTTGAFIQSMGFKNYSIKNIWVFVSDSAYLSIIPERRIYGFLTGDFLNKYIVTINFNKKEIEIRNPHSLKSLIFLHNLEQRAQKTDLTLIDNIPYVKALVDTSPQRLFRVDLGLYEGLFIRDIFAQGNNLISKNKKQIPWNGFGASGSHNYTLVRMNSFQIDSTIISEPIAAITELLPNGAPYEHESGIIGMKILKRFNLTLDYPHKHIYFEKNSSFDEREEFLPLGILPNFNKDNEYVEIESVYKGTPAEKAGLKPNDEILAINGIPISSIPNLYNYVYESFVLGRNGRNFKLKIKNTDGIKDLSVNLVSLI